MIGYWSVDLITADMGSAETVSTDIDRELTNILDEFRDHPHQTSAVVTWHYHARRNTPCTCRQKRPDGA